MRILLFFLVLISVVGYSQKITIVKGPVIDQKQLREQLDIKRFSFIRKNTSVSSTVFFDTRERKAYTGYGLNGGAFWFMSFNDYVNPSGMKKLSAEFVSTGDKETVQMVGFVRNTTKLFILYTIDFPDQDQFSLYVNEVNGDMQLMGTPILVSSFSGLKQSGSGLGLEKSKDEQSFLVFRLFNTKAKEKQKFECRLLDASFGEVWQKVFEPGNLDKELSIQSFQVDNSGNCYILAERTLKGDKRPILMSYLYKTKSFTISELGLDVGDNYGANLELLGGVKPYVVGINKQKKNFVYFVNRFNVSSGTMELLGSSMIDKDFNRFANIGGFDDSHWGVVNLVSLENNDLVATFEASLVMTKNGVIYGYSNYYTYVVSFTEDGKSKWTHVVRKKQMGIMGSFLSHYVFPYKNKVLIVYNDRPENMKRALNYVELEVFSGKDAMMTVQEIDDQGKATKYPLTKDPQLANYSLNLETLSKIQDNLYHSGVITFKSRTTVDSRAVTIKIE
ncbi:MAG: hypothetical protein HOP08_17190 [Cyclobacteriaceae bacterium]|nr:hypothetical protein [Cyclobacteriaceae bacterium]